MPQKNLHNNKTNFSSALNSLDKCYSICDSKNQNSEVEKELWDKINILDKKQDYKSMEKILIDFLAIYPNNFDAIFKLARTYQKQSLNAKAKEIYEECIKNNNRKVYSTRMLGEICLSEKKFTEAEKLFKKCTEIDSKEFISWINLGITYNYMNKNEQAVNAFKHSLLIKSDAAWPRIELGKLYAFQGNLHEAEKWFLECLKNDPANILARVYLSRINIAYNNIQKANQYITECRNLGSSDRKVILVENEIDAIRNYDISRRFAHIKKHESNDYMRKFHGVFNGNSEIIVKNAWKAKDNIKPIQKIEVKIYNIPYPNAGYQGGANGRKLELNYVTLIVLGIDEKLITAFPSDGLVKEFFTES